MEIVKIIIQVLSGIISVWMMFAMLYQLFLNLFGFKRAKRDYAEHDPEAKFLILVPAHNEAAVIKDIIHSLKAMDYPKELYDFFIIADNCTDNTAEIARSLGAGVIETRKETPDSPTGKPIALKKALDAIGDYQNKYDLMMIFDADNVMDSNMLREVNSQYQDKNHPELIQCYLGCKNKKGPIAWFYYTSYVVVNRFTQLARYRLGINNCIGGTGFAISTQYLYNRGGWTTMSLTEDFEIQVEATLAGKRILWNHFTRVYDEKPTKAMASYRQKTRWSQGYTFVCFRNTGKVFKALFSGRLSVKEFLGTFSYMWGMFTYIFVVLQAIFQALLMFVPAFGFQARPTGVFDILPGILLFIYSYLVLFYVAEKMDDHSLSLKKLPLMLYSLVINMAISIACQFVGLAKYRQQQNWDKTEHVISADSVNQAE
ncbi:MAG: glycosyltransferase family 2 protein [Clostridia bacterium]|nr:glycosyltransferase family 2 protein [Clostridia bacterium]